MKTSYRLKCKGFKTSVTLLLLMVTGFLYGQGPAYSWYYRVYLSDKGENSISNYSPEDLLSERAINRREKAGIAVPDIRDIPVYQGYIDKISSAGFNLHCTSKWMNTALFKTVSAADINLLLNLPFVTDVKIVRSPAGKSIYSDKLYFTLEQAELPPYDRPVTMVNGSPLHDSGFDGKNVLIAILDGGFLNGELISSVKNLRDRKGIKATYDFVNNSGEVYNSSTHGTAVLSVLAGNIPGQIEGTAQGADYLLLKTEDVGSEFPCEEDFWAAGAEFADSAGANIISSSLGYYKFDDPALNYKYSDLDGNTAFVTVAADIAASKGILVVNSAGNERTNSWKRIIFPSDGDSVLAVGAVDGNNLISSFSSAGPSSDGRVKPDNATMGVNVPVQISASGTGRSNGTSFSCPVLSGMAACLMQAVPMALNIDIINVLRSSSDRYNSPDSLYGYGIPEMVTALKKLQELLVRVPDEEMIAGPNPTTGDIEFVFRNPPENLTLEIISMTGKVLFRKVFPEYAGRTILITELQNKEQGIYFIRLTMNGGIIVHKIIKLRN
jgi:serine protease AprX